MYVSTDSHNHSSLSSIQSISTEYKDETNEALQRTLAIESLTNHHQLSTFHDVKGEEKC